MIRMPLDHWLNVKVVVCDKCLRASCWHGMFMCEEAKDAGTVERTRRELIALNRESTDYMMESGAPQIKAVVVEEF